VICKYSHILSTCLTLSRKVVLSVLLLAGLVLSTRAQERVRIYFPFDNSELSANYLSNAGSLSQLDSCLAVNIPDQLEVVTFSSPEGNVQYNLNLSKKRAQSVQRYLESRYPALKGRIVLNAGAESWEDLRSRVVEDVRLSEDVRASVLQIIDNSLEPDEKERSLKALPEYQRLYSNYFRNLRYAAVVLPSASVASGSHSGSYTQNGSAAGSSSASYVSEVAGGSDTDIRFDLRSATVHATEANEELLSAFDNLLSRISEEDLKSLSIVGWASPEGPEAVNNRLSGARAQNLESLVVSRYPALRGKVNVVNGGENWGGLRRAVEQDSVLSAAERQEILDIIDSSLSAKEKEARLRALPAYGHLFEDVFPSLRSASILVGIQPEILVANSDAYLADTQVIAGGKPTLPQMSYRTIEQKYEEERPILAVSTNVLYDLAITPNFAVEVPIGPQWSVYADYTFPWWVNRANDWAWEILKLDVGGRYWLTRHSDTDKMDVLNGHFVGITGMGGYYDIEPKHEGYQGEFLAAGLEYGYAWNLGKNRKWRLEASAAAGWMGTKYRYYIGNSTDEHLLYQNNGKLNWWGPIKANVSIKYIFSHKVTRRAGR